jgi:hypothetical protein
MAVLAVDGECLVYTISTNQRIGTFAQRRFPDA